MNGYIRIYLVLLFSLISPVSFANTAEYDGDSSYELHLGPPTLYVSGDSAKKLMTDLHFSKKRKKVVVTIDCQDNSGTQYPDSCAIEFRNR